MHRQHGFAHATPIVIGGAIIVLAALAFVTVKTHMNDARVSLGANPDAGKPTAESYAVCDTPEKRGDVTGAFTYRPFDTSNLRFITAGDHTDSGDPRFVYPWIKQGASVDIYAPADGTLTTIRHKVASQADGTIHRDFDIFFLVDAGCQATYRFNHVTSPRSDIAAAYRGTEDQASGDYANGGLDDPNLIVPLTKIHVTAGEKLGTTTGTPVAHNFDYALSILDKAPSATYSGTAACPLDVFPGSIRTTLMNLLAPDQYSGPVPGTPCNVHEIGR